MSDRHAPNWNVHAERPTALYEVRITNGNAYVAERIIYRVVMYNPVTEQRSVRHEGYYKDIHTTDELKKIIDDALQERAYLSILGIFPFEDGFKKVKILPFVVQGKEDARHRY